MKKLSVVARASLLAMSVSLLSPVVVQAQNITTVNGKPVPKSRADNLLQQATRQSGQPATPELEKQVRDEVVLRGGDRSSLNMRGALLEVFGDMLGSIAAILAAVVILVTGFAPADAIASLVIAALIVPRALLLLRDSAVVLL